VKSALEIEVQKAAKSGGTIQDVAARTWQRVKASPTGAKFDADEQLRIGFWISSNLGDFTWLSFPMDPDAPVNGR
jgi:hypothetical protein